MLHIVGHMGQHLNMQECNNCLWKTLMKALSHNSRCHYQEQQYISRFRRFAKSNLSWQTLTDKGLSQTSIGLNTIEVRIKMSLSI